ncbi:hypothetical protein FRB90_005281 [Tulasnella sp. 427]|nr:hypothetical protein FRB90_005281 [Tulasnella sp. 427]
MTMLPRVMDKVYLGYFTLALFIAICIDLQDYWPQGTLPGFLKQIKLQYIADSSDPLLTGALGGPSQTAWLLGSLVHMLTSSASLFQLPALALIVGGILQGWRSTYIWILAYCVSSAATTIPCVYTILAIPNTETVTTVGTLALSSAQKRFLLYNYLPFLVFPLIAAVDSGLQLGEDVKLAVTARKAMEGKTQ